MEFTVGDELIELEIINDLVIRPHHQAIAFAIATYVSSEVQRMMPAVDGTLIAPIASAYHGAYPAIGVRYRTDLSELQKEELSAAVRLCVERIMATATIVDFAVFASRKTESWQITWDKAVAEMRAAGQRIEMNKRSKSEPES